MESDGFGASGSHSANSGDAQADSFSVRETQKQPEPTPSYTYEPSTQNDEPDYSTTASGSHAGYGGGDSTLSSTMALKKPDGALIPSRRVKSKIVAQIGDGQVERDLQVVVQSKPELAAPQAFRNQGFDRQWWNLPCVANTNLICIGDSQLKAPGEYRFFRIATHF